MPAKRVGAALRRSAQGRSRRRALEHLCRPRRDPLLSAARCPACRTTSSAQAVIVAKDVAARERLQAKLEKLLAEDFPSVGRARLSARTRAAGRLARAISRQRPGRRPGARDRASSSPRSSRPIRKAEKVNFDWIEPARQVRIRVDQDEARLLGLSSQALAERAQHRHLRHRRHPGARRHLPRRCRGARDRRAARLARRRCAPCRCRCRAGARCRSASSRPSSMSRTIPLVWRRDRVPTLTVQADVAPGALPETVVDALAPAIEALRKTPAASLPHRRRRHGRGERRSRRPPSSPWCR